MYNIQPHKSEHIEAKADDLVVIDGSEVLGQPDLALHFTISHCNSNCLIEPSPWKPFVFLIIFTLNDLSKAHLQPSDDVRDAASVCGKDDVIDFAKLLVGRLEVLLINEVGLETLVGKLELWIRGCPDRLAGLVAELQARAPHEYDGFEVILHERHRALLL